LELASLFSKLQALQLKPEAWRAWGHDDLTKEKCQRTCAQALAGCLTQCWSSSELADLQEQVSKSSIAYDATSMQRAFIAAHGQQACRPSGDWKTVIQICIATEANADWLLLIRQQDQSAASEYGMANARRWSYLSTCLSVTPEQQSDAATSAGSQ